MDTLENLHTKSQAAKDLKSVVKSMKAMAASNISQYEAASNSLGDYYRTVALGISAFLKAENIDSIMEKKALEKYRDKTICIIVFGSDQGLVGRFNDSISEFVFRNLNSIPGKKEIWAIGERVQLLLSDAGYAVTNFFPVPNAVTAITSLVNQILNRSEQRHKNQDTDEFYIFHNQPKPGSGYQAVMQKFLPLDEKWKKTIEEFQWPTKLPPQVAGGPKPTLLALISEYLFVSLYKACAESLSSENASRLEAMQRAEKNIEEIISELGVRIQGLRQSTIDEELFDVISGFEAIIRHT
jgi:F-type H+-transporting ATPase subunit gamma